MSHHFDTVIAREDPRLNLLDFYLFRGRPGTTVMAMTVNPNAGTKAPDTIVVEVPTQLIGDPAATVRAWVTVSLCGHAPEVQVSRWGLPLMTHAFITDPAVKDDYNRSTPAADVPRFSQIVADALARVTQLAGSAGDPAAYAQRVVERLFPTTLPYVLDSAASFGFAGFNGRALTDNVENVMLSLQANTPIDQDAAVDRPTSSVSSPISAHRTP